MRLAIDPGMTTGLAVRYAADKWSTFAVEGTVPVLIGWIQKLASEDFNSPLEEVVIEKFLGTQRYMSKYGIETIELIGAVKALCHLMSIPLVFQTPSQKFPFMDEARGLLVERRKAWRLSFTDHDQDALAHLLRREYDCTRV